jgi:hypothetical protein
LRLGLELEHHAAALGQLHGAVGAQDVAQLARGGAGREREQGAQALEEDAVVAHEIDDGECALAFAGAEPAAELLQEHHAGLGGPEHHDAVEAGHVHALVEDVHGAHRVERAVAQAFDGRVAVVGAFGGEHGGHAETSGGEPVAHEDGVVDTGAEDQGALTGVVLPGAPQGLHALLGLGRRGELLGVEAMVAPRDVRVVDGVGDAEVVKRHEPRQRDAAADVGAIGHEVIEEAEDVGVVGALGRGRESQQEARLHGRQDAAITLGRGVVHLVHHDIVEPLGAQPGHVGGPRQLGHRGEHQRGRQLAAVLGEPTHGGARVHVVEEPAIRTRRLQQELTAMGQEEYARPVALTHLVAELAIVQRRQHGLAEPGSQHHQRARAPLFTRRAQRREGLTLHRVGLGQRLDGFGLDLARGGGGARRQRQAGPRGIVTHELLVERRGGGPLVLEGLPHGREGPRVVGAVHAQVPLDAGVERGVREVAAAHEGQTEVGRLEPPGLGVERARATGEPGHLHHADLERAAARGVARRWVGEVGGLRGVVGLVGLTQGGGALESEEALERGGGGDLEIVSGEDADGRAARQGGAERRLDTREPGVLDEGRHDGDVVG